MDISTPMCNTNQDQSVSMLWHCWSPGTVMNGSSVHVATRRNTPKIGSARQGELHTVCWLYMHKGRLSAFQVGGCKVGG